MKGLLYAQEEVLAVGTAELPVGEGMDGRDIRPAGQRLQVKGDAAVVEKGVTILTDVFAEVAKGVIVVVEGPDDGIHTLGGVAADGGDLLSITGYKLMLLRL